MDRISKWYQMCFHWCDVSDLRTENIHYNDVIMSAIASQITSLTIVYSTVYSDTDQRKLQSSASLAFVRGIHRWLVNSPHIRPAMRKMFPFDDVIMTVVRFIANMLEHSHIDAKWIIICLENYIVWIPIWHEHIRLILYGISGMQNTQFFYKLYVTVRFPAAEGNIKLVYHLKGKTILRWWAGCCRHVMPCVCCVVLCCVMFSQALRKLHR